MVNASNYRFIPHPSQVRVGNANPYNQLVQSANEHRSMVTRCLDTILFQFTNEQYGKGAAAAEPLLQGLGDLLRRVPKNGYPLTSRESYLQEVAETIKAKLENCGDTGFKMKVETLVSEYLQNEVELFQILLSLTS